MAGIPDPISREEVLGIARLECYNVRFFEEPLSYLAPGSYDWLRERTTVQITSVDFT